MNGDQSVPHEKDLTAMGDNRLSADFLLAEFGRLKDIRSELGQRASKRFQFYLTITTAALGAFLVIYKMQQTPVPYYIFDIVALGLIGYGLITFMNLTFASTFHVKVVRASRRIQDYFVERDPDIFKYLYFSNAPTDTKNRYGFLGVLWRGLGGGSEKSVIVFMNSALLSYLIFTLFDRYLPSSLSQVPMLIIIIITFLISGFAHAVYVSKMYKYTIESSWD